MITDKLSMTNADLMNILKLIDLNKDHQWFRRDPEVHIKHFQMLSVVGVLLEAAAQSLSKCKSLADSCREFHADLLQLSQSIMERILTR